MACQGKAKHGKAWHVKARQGMEFQGETRHVKVRHGLSRKDMTRFLIIEFEINEAVKHQMDKISISYMNHIS